MHSKDEMRAHNISLFLLIQTEAIESTSEKIKAFSVRIEETTVFANTRDNCIVAWSLEVT